MRRRACSQLWRIAITPMAIGRPTIAGKIEFPAGTAVGEVINRLIVILQGAAQPEQ